MLLLLLGEQDARLDRLTRRQLEILERIYEQLNVHTRTAATAVFLSSR